MNQNIRFEFSGKNRWIAFNLLITRLLSFCPIICFEQTPLLNEILFRNSTRCNNLNEIFYKLSITIVIIRVEIKIISMNQRFHICKLISWTFYKPGIAKVLTWIVEDFSKWCKVLRADTHSPRMIENNMPPLE